MLMEHLSHMVLHHSNTSGHMLLESLLVKVAFLVNVPAILVVILIKFLLLLAVTTTVRVVSILLVLLMVYFPILILCGMVSNVLVQRLPAVLTPTCRGSSRHSVRPPLRIFSLDCVTVVELLMRKLYCS